MGNPGAWSKILHRESPSMCMLLVFLFQELLGLLQRSRKLLSDRLDQVGGKSSFIVLTFICWSSTSIKSLYIAQLCPGQERLASINDSSTNSSSADRA